MFLTRDGCLGVFEGGLEEDIIAGYLAMRSQFMCFHATCLAQMLTYYLYVGVIAKSTD